MEVFGLGLYECDIQMICLVNLDFCFIHLSEKLVSLHRGESVRRCGD